MTEYFTPIQNKNIKTPPLDVPVKPFIVNENLGKFVQYQTIKDREMLSVFWVLPHLSHRVETDPMYYLTQLFGHEGKNSLLSYLKKEGLAISLEASSQDRLDVYTSFVVDV